MFDFKQGVNNVKESCAASQRWQNGDFYGKIFTDFESNDFSFKENSPAYELGISKIDVNKIGVQHNWYF